MPRDEWEALKRGEGCPMCSSLRDPDLFQPGYANEYGRTIAQLGASVLRLGRDQFTTGYCVLIGTNHGPEPDDLDEDQWLQYSRDLRVANAAIKKAVGADKMNLELLGNAVPHLHHHSTPRFWGDGSPGARLIKDHQNPVLLSPTDEAALGHRIAAGLH